MYVCPSVCLSVYMFTPIQNDINIDYACFKCVREVIKFEGLRCVCVHEGIVVSSTPPNHPSIYHFLTGINWSRFDYKILIMIANCEFSKVCNQKNCKVTLSVYYYVVWGRPLQLLLMYIRNFA